MVSNLPASLPLSESTIAKGGELFVKVWTKVVKVCVQSFTNIIPRLLYVELQNCIQQYSKVLRLKYFVLSRFLNVIGSQNNCPFLRYTVFRFNSLFYTENHSVPNFFVRFCRFSVYRGHVLVRFNCNTTPISLFS